MRKSARICLGLGLALVSAGASAQTVTGSGTTNTVPVFTGSSTVGNSPISVSGSNVGIGTTSPTLATLQINNPGANSNNFLYAPHAWAAAIRFYTNNGYGYWSNNFDYSASSKDSSSAKAASIGLYTSTDDASPAITFNAATTTSSTMGTLMSILSGGNVGIGTSTPKSPLEINYAAGTSQLADMLRLNAVNGSLGNGAGILFTNNGDVMKLARIAGVDDGNWGGNLLFYTAPATGSSPGGTPTERMRITDAGNIGIGTTNPGSAYLLDVAGAIRSSSGGIVFPDGSAQITAFNPNQTGSLQIGNGNYILSSTSANGATNVYNQINNWGSGYFWQIMSPAGYGNLASLLPLRAGQNLSAGQFNLYNSADSQSDQSITVQFNGAANGNSYFNTGGNVGIGTTSPGALLSVGANSQFQVSSSGAVSTSGGLTVSSGTVSFPAGSIASSALQGGGSLTTTALGTANTWAATQTFNNGLYVSSQASSWLSGAIGTYGITASPWQDPNSYYSVLRQKTAGGNFVSLGGLGNVFGFYGYSASRVAAGTNGFDYSLVMDLATGNVGIGTTSPAYKLDVAGQIHTAGGIVFPDGSIQSVAYAGCTGGDYAESVNVSGDHNKYAPGDVLVIASDEKGDVVKSTEAYSTMVVGIYSTKPGVLGRRQTSAKTPDEIPMAMLGIVPTKVSAENGPIRRGDLLVTSSIEGYAMKGTDRNRLTGAVIGKALGSLDSGTGVIEVVVTLQ